MKWKVGDKVQITMKDDTTWTKFEVGDECVIDGIYSEESVMLTRSSDGMVQVVPMRFFS